MSLYGAQTENCHLTVSAPSAGGVGDGAYTVAILFKPNLFNGAQMIWRAYNSSNFSHRGLYVDGDMWIINEQADTNIPSFSNPPQWYWFVASKSSADEAPRAHWAVYDATNPFSWTHLDALSVQVARPQINRLCLGDEFDMQFRGNVACWVAFTSELSDLDIELFFERSSSDIMSASPQFFMHWPEAAGVSGAFEDIAGGGVETIRTGNWAVSADPPNYNFSLGPSGKPKVWDGSSWVQRQTKTYNGTIWVPAKMAGATVTGWVTSR